MTRGQVLVVQLAESARMADPESQDRLTRCADFHAALSMVGGSMDVFVNRLSRAPVARDEEEERQQWADALVAAFCECS